MSALSVNDQQWAGKTKSASGQREDSRTTKSTLMTWLDSCFLMMQARLIMLCAWVIIIRALILSTGHARALSAPALSFRSSINTFTYSFHCVCVLFIYYSCIFISLLFDIRKVSRVDIRSCRVIA